jgi:acyl-CoA synthetase (AMP-forming)/AMP-acid ligase II
MITTTVAQSLTDAADRHADRIALVDGSQRVDYRTLKHRVDRVAGGLRARGLRPGDRVAVWMGNRVEWVLAYLGIVQSGAVAVPVNTALTVPEAGYLFDQSGARAVVVAESHVQAARDLRDGLGQPLEIIVVFDSTAAASVPASDLTSFAALEQADAHTAAMDAADPAVMLYTSGTTGSPKGAVHSHRFLATLESAARRLQLRPEDVLVLYLPLYHVYALMAGLHLMLGAGARLVLMRQFRASESLALMASERATIVYGVPTTYLDQLNDPGIEQHDLSRVRVSFTPFPMDLCRRVSARFGCCLNSFGMTETASLAFLASPDDEPELAMSKAGRALEGLEARIVDETTGADAEPDKVGQLMVRGPSIMLGYHDKPAETAAVLSRDGWLRTGDLASLDAQGRLTFVGRASDQYRVGGESVDPVEVETALQSHPEVERAAALGVADERLGQVGHAWVQLHPGSVATERDLLDHVSDRLARFKIPRKITLIDRLPTNPSGKVQKFRLRDDTR